MRELTAAAEAVDGVGTSFDLRHDPSDEEDPKERDGLGDEQEAWRGRHV